MRNVLALLGAATVTFLAVGWYLGWYKVDSTPQVGHQGLHVDINTDKALKDIGTGIDRVAEKVQEYHVTTADTKPAPLSTPQGPASSFFGPTPKATDKLIPANTVSRPVAQDDDSRFGIELPRR